MSAMLPKVFGVGLSRTGTKSLVRALSLLGYKAGHYDVSIRIIQLIHSELMLIPKRVKEWDALSDIPVSLFYQELDSFFPGSFFILTVREKASWLDSCERHSKLSLDPYIAEKNIDLQLVQAVRHRMYQTIKFSRDQFSAVYDLHVKNVKNYFTGRQSQLLILDIASGQGWLEVCSFLGRPVPDFPFPHENRRLAR